MAENTEEKEIQLLSEEHSDFYKKLRRKIQRWLDENGVENKYAAYLLLAPDFFYLLVKLVQDERVPGKEKVKLLAVIGYFISPVDLMPELILGPIGFIDDVALAAFALNGMINRVESGIVHENWPGDGDVLEEIQNVIQKADEMIGSGLIKKIKKYLA